jgi:hypothetical protein
MHRRLALGFALFGLGLAAVYLLRLWFFDTARSLAQIQPTPSGVIRNAMMLLLGFMILGAMAAVVVHKIDPRVYIASDVEHLLGIAPVAQMPDFSEVPDEVAEEHLTRLAVWIDSAVRDRGAKSFVFTGTGPGAGATTVASRVKESLEALGRMAVVITDTAPLTVSAETENLAWSADCTIVVIESGVTTRAQLRTAASVLQRLNAPLVGFVLNRVQLAKADRAFRRSVEEMEQHLGSEDQFTDQQMLRTLQRAIEAGRASLESENASVLQGIDYPAARMTAVAAPAGQRAQAIAPEPVPQANPTAEANPGAAAAPREPEPASRPARTDAVLTREEIPWRPVEPPAHTDTQPRAPHGESWQPVSWRSVGGQPAQETEQPVLEETTRATLPRLCELRGMLFTAGLKQLDPARRGAPQSAEGELLMTQIAPFEPLLNPAEPAQRLLPAQATQAEPKRVEPARTFIPVPEAEVTAAAKSGAGSPGNGSQRGEAQSKFHLTKRVKPAKSRAQRGEGDGRTNRGPNHGTQERAAVSDEVWILPSKKGQYKRKD